MRTMEINGLKAQVHLPDAPKGEGVHALPPSCVQDVYQVDRYNCPTNWMHGSGVASSYFIGIEPGKHLWLDFNDNWSHSHHVAIVMSIQGINPVNGMPTKYLRMEQYREKCPLHDHPFGADRFCQMCADKVPATYQGINIEHFPTKWAPQSYMTTVSHDPRKLWADGWYKDADEVLGFLITEETVRGVAANIIGEDRVFAIGIAFFLSKEPKPVATHFRDRDITLEASAGASADGGELDTCEYLGPLGPFDPKIPFVPPPYEIGPSGQSMNMSNSPKRMRSRGALPALSSPIRIASLSCESRSMGLDTVREATLGGHADAQDAQVVPYDDRVLTKLEIGAGARIKQDLCKFDPSNLDFYQSEPAGLIYVNYCLRSERDRILAAGMLKEQVGSFLDRIPTGNP